MHRSSLRYHWIGYASKPSLWALRVWPNRILVHPRPFHCGNKANQPHSLWRPYVYFNFHVTGDQWSLISPRLLRCQSDSRSIHRRSHTHGNNLVVHSEGCICVVPSNHIECTWCKGEYSLQRPLSRSRVRVNDSSDQPCWLLLHGAESQDAFQFETLCSLAPNLFIHLFMLSHDRFYTRPMCNLGWVNSRRLWSYYRKLSILLNRYGEIQARSVHFWDYGHSGNEVCFYNFRDDFGGPLPDNDADNYSARSVCRLNLHFKSSSD